MLDFICKNHSNQLCDSGEDQVGMQGLFILGATAGKAEVFFDMVDIPLYDGSYFVGIIPLFCAAYDTGISLEKRM